MWSKRRDFGRERGLKPTAGQPATGLRVIPPVQWVFARKPVAAATNLLLLPERRPKSWANPEKYQPRPRQSAARQQDVRSYQTLQVTDNFRATIWFLHS